MIASAIRHVFIGDEAFAIRHAFIRDEAFQSDNQRYLVIRDPYKAPVEAREVPYEFARLVLTSRHYLISELPHSE